MPATQQTNGSVEITWKINCAQAKDEDDIKAKYWRWVYWCGRDPQRRPSAIQWTSTLDKPTAWLSWDSYGTWQWQRLPIVWCLLVSETSGKGCTLAHSLYLTLSHTHTLSLTLTHTHIHSHSILTLPSAFSMHSNGYTNLQLTMNQTAPP